MVLELLSDVAGDFFHHSLRGLISSLGVEVDWGDFLAIHKEIPEKSRFLPLSLLSRHLYGFFSKNLDPPLPPKVPYGP